jgi:hypothetical protein
MGILQENIENELRMNIESSVRGRYRWWKNGNE